MSLTNPYVETVIEIEPDAIEHGVNIISTVLACFALSGWAFASLRRFVRWPKVRFQKKEPQ